MDRRWGTVHDQLFTSGKKNPKICGCELTVQLPHYNSPAHKGEWESNCVVNNKAKKTLNAKYDEKASAFNHKWDWFNIEWPAKQKINWLRDACSRSISVYLANKNGAVSSSTWPLKVIEKLKGRCGFVGRNETMATTIVYLHHLKTRKWKLSLPNPVRKMPPFSLLCLFAGIGQRHLDW